MKKFLKGFLMFSLAFVLLCPLALAGCSKNYTMKVELDSNDGRVYLWAQDGINAVGSNTVKKGDNFEILIDPNDGYIISKIELDGEEVEIHTYEDGKFGYKVSEVKKNHTIKVYFELDTYVVKFMCLENPNGGYIEYTPLRTYVKYKSGIDLSEQKYSGPTGMVQWYIDPACETPVPNNSIKPNRDWELYCRITKDSLDSQLGGAQI